MHVISEVFFPFFSSISTGVEGVQKISPPPLSSYRKLNVTDSSAFGIWDICFVFQVFNLFYYIHLYTHMFICTSLFCSPRRYLMVCSQKEWEKNCKKLYGIQTSNQQKSWENLYDRGFATETLSNLVKKVGWSLTSGKNVQMMGALFHSCKHLRREGQCIK